MNAHTGPTEHPAPDVVSVLVESCQMQMKPRAEAVVRHAHLLPERVNPFVEVVPTPRPLSRTRTLA